MEDSKLYTAHDIEILKQKITTYRDTLNALKTGNSIDGYLFIKNEFNDFKTQISHLEGQAEIMDDKQSAQLEGYEQQVKQFSVQINALNQTVEELNQDLSLIINKIGNDNRNESIEHINAPVEAREDNEVMVVNFIEETIQPKDQTSFSSFKQSNGPPSFKQLQYLATKAHEIQETPNNVDPSESIGIEKKIPEEQQFSKKSFPSTGINPSQHYNGRNKNVPMTSVIHLNKNAKKQVIAIRANENSVLSSVLATNTNDPEKHETVTQYSDEVIYVAPIEVPIEVMDVAPIEVENASIEIPIEVMDFAPIEVENASIEIPIEVMDFAPNEVENASIEVPIEVMDFAPIEVENASIEIPIDVMDTAPIEVENASIEIPIEVMDTAPIEVENASIEIPIEVMDTAPIEVENTSIEIPIEVMDVSPIRVENAPIEVPIDVKDVAPIEVGNAPFEISIELNNVAPIEAVNSSIGISDEVNDVAPIEVGNSSIGIPDEVNDVAPIEVPNEMKRQQHKNKKTFSLFDLFSKKL